MQNFRFMIVIIGLSLLLGGCGVINKVRLMNANDDLTPNWEEQHSIAKPDADYVYAKPYIFASINGVSNLKFLIDTGSSISMLFDTPKVKPLQLTQGYELKVGGFGGHEYSKAYQTEVDTLIIDHIVFNKVNFGYIPLSKTQFFVRPDQAGFDGVIGNDILKGLVWHFDRDANQVSIYQQLPDSLNNKEAVWVAFDTFFGKISFPVKITFSDHILERDVILDTGSRYHMSINDAYFGGNKAFPSPVIRSAGYSLSGMALHVKANTPLVEVGDLKFSNVLTNIIEEDEDDFWTLGSALLSQYEIIVDYPNMRIGFVSREGHSFKSQYNLLGLELRKLQNGNFIVAYSSPDLPAKALNFDIGTEISSINGIKSQDISVDEWLKLVSKEGEFELCLYRSAQCKRVESKQIPGLSK